MLEYIEKKGASRWHFAPQGPVGRDPGRAKLRGDADAWHVGRDADPGDEEAPDALGRNSGGGLRRHPRRYTWRNSRRNPGRNARVRGVASSCAGSRVIKRQFARFYIMLQEMRQFSNAYLAVIKLYKFFRQFWLLNCKNINIINKSHRLSNLGA